ncbi:histidinol-phosphate transaminase [Oribacterium sp. C9]|uniref:pyridoxal phosphate-dependent aminotransferase n=1 Tax=Oribacterium sp. C9 TaxID=1943579 RepID=UPI00098FBAD8|nr:histidinol-phosphate transaminase [Oribacterium sp. C9]OON87371.1 histidinol-phosphate transaminase [Oribacterium sp. C9]
MSKFFNSIYKGLTPYTPGEQPQDKKYIKLNTNESPFPPAPGVIAAVNDREAADLRLYSDPELKPLKAQLAETFSVNTDNVFIGNGSDEVLNYAFMAFCEDGIAFPDITYSFYSVIADLNQVKTDIKPLNKDFTVDISAYLGEKASEGNSEGEADKSSEGSSSANSESSYKGIGKSIVIANPNAPTGIRLSLDDISKICEANRDHVVMIDEAYVDFAEEGSSAVALIDKYDNLLVTQTFSKSRSMAGARVGFALGNSALIQDLETLRNSNNPYNVNRISMKCAVEALRDKEYFDLNCRKIKENRAYTKKALEGLGFRVLPSETNFLFAESNMIEGGELYKALKEKGILVRHFSDPKISNFNRITVGSREEMDAFLDQVSALLDFPDLRCGS